MSRYVTDTHALIWHLTGNSNMPDRIITATAYQLRLPLITRDEKIKKSKTVKIIW